MGLSTSGGFSFAGIRLTILYVGTMQTCSVCLLQGMSWISDRRVEIKASETFCCNFVSGRLTRHKVSNCTGPLKIL